MKEFSMHNCVYKQSSSNFKLWIWIQYLRSHCPGPLNSDGQLSNFAHFENCTFIGNTAEHFGAAIGLISPVLVFNRFNSEKVTPFEIENWWVINYSYLIPAHLSTRL